MKELDDAKKELAKVKESVGDGDDMGVVQDVMNAATIQAITEDNRQLKAENDRLKQKALRCESYPKPQTPNPKP